MLTRFLDESRTLLRQIAQAIIPGLNFHSTQYALNTTSS